MIAIDHEAYPHIIDAVWDELDLSCVLAARNTCSSWRKRADAVLQRHMVAEIHSNDMVLRSKHTDVIPSLPRYRWGPDASITASRSLETIMACRSTPELVDEISSNIEVVDVTLSRHLKVNHSNMENLSMRIPNRNTVIRTRVSASYPSRREVPQGYAPTQVYFFALDSHVGVDASFADTIVLNIDCKLKDSSPLTSYQDISRYLHLEHDCEQIVLVFNHRGFKFVSFHPASAYLLLSFMQFHFWRGDALLVGLEDAFDKEDDYNQFRAGFLDLAQDTVTDAPSEALSACDSSDSESEGVGTSGTGLRVLTRAEYRDMVGQKRFNIYTQW